MNFEFVLNVIVVRPVNSPNGNVAIVSSCPFSTPLESRPFDAPQI
jgi:hypothetical protein